MLYFDRIDVSEGIDVSKTTESKECDIRHYWYFLDKGFEFQSNVCNRYHDLLMMSMNLINIYISNMQIIAVLLAELAKMARKLMQNADLTEKSKTL